MPNSLFSEPSDQLKRTWRWLDVAGLVVMAALALTPLVFDPAAQDDAYFAPKWAWIASWTVLGLGCLVARVWLGRPARAPLHPIVVAAVLLVAWHWVAVIWAASPSLAVERAGRITWVLIGFWLTAQWLRWRRSVGWVAGMACVVGVATGLWVFVEDIVREWYPGLVWIRNNLPDWRGFIGAGLGNTNHTGDYLALALLATLGLIPGVKRRGARNALVVAAVLIPGALVICFSAGSNLGLVIGALVMGGMFFSRDRGRWFGRRWGRWVCVLAGWALVLLFFTTDHPANPHRPSILAEGFGSQRWQAGGPTRLVIWAQTLEMIREHPITGIGTGNFTYLFPQMDSPLIADRPDLLIYQGNYTNGAHNAILQTWAELGMIGLFLWGCLIIAAFHTLLKGIHEADERSYLSRATLTGLLVAWLAHAQVNFVFQQPVGLLTFFTLMAAIVIEHRTRPHASRMPSLRWESDWVVLHVDWLRMNRPTAVGFALLLPQRIGATLAMASMLAALIWVGRLWGPVRAQREYRRAKTAVAVNSHRAAEECFLRALELDPDAHDVRSAYTVWLLDQNRPQAALEHLAIVRERLNSNELWLREARAFEALGRPEEAREAQATYTERVWRARQGLNQPQPK